MVVLYINIFLTKQTNQVNNTFGEETFVENKRKEKFLIFYD